MRQLTRTSAGRCRLRRRDRGFTLLEITIASGVLLLVMALTANSIFGFSRTGNQMHAQSLLEEQLRNSLNRLEKELIEGAEVLASFDPGSGAVTTDEHTLVMKVPVYTSAGFIAVESNGLPVSDTVIIESETDSQAEFLSLNRSPQLRPNRLVLTLIPHAKSNRTPLTKQVIAKDLMPVSGVNYSFPTHFGSANAGGDNGPTFTYYKMDASDKAVVANVSSEADDVSQIKVLLWGEKDASGRQVTAKKELDIRLRNWKDPNQAPTSP